MHDRRGSTGEFPKSLVFNTWKVPRMDRIQTTATRVLILATLCLTLYGVLGPDSLPGSELFALGALAASAYAGGWVVGCFKLPPLVGMLAIGILYRNLPFVPFSKDISTKWASALRSASLSIILLKAGLGLDAAKLRSLGPSVAALSLVPCLAEAGVSAVTARLLLGLPWLWAWMLGFILSAVSAAILVPGALCLSEAGLGSASGVPTLLMASVSMDNVAALTGFLVAMNVLTSDSGSLATAFLGQLLEPVVGLATGAAFGVLLWYLPGDRISTERPSPNFQQSGLLCMGGLAFTFVSLRTGVSGVGALACVSLAFCASLRWRQHAENFKSITRITGILWQLLEPFLFGLIGAEVTLDSLKSNIGYGTVVLFCGVTVRMLATVFALLGSGLNLRERLFVSLSWMSKATVQAAVGSKALDYGRTHDKGTQFEEFGNQILTVSVLSILLTAPLGAMFMDLLGHRLLKKDESNSKAEENIAIMHDTPKPTAPSYGSCMRADKV